MREEINLLKWLEAQAKLHGNDVIVEDGELTLTYRSFWTESLNLANELRKTGVTSATSLCLASSDYIAFYVSLVAGWLCEANVVPLNLNQTNEEILKCFKTVDSNVVVTSDIQLLELFEGNVLFWQLGQLPAVDCFKIPENAEIPLTIFTSGSTGNPKAVKLSMSKVTENAMLVSEQLGIKPGNRLLINTPPFYTSGLIHFLTQAVRGAALVCRSGFFFGASLLQEIEKTKSDGFGGAPAHFMKILGSSNQVNLPLCLKYMVSSGDHLPKHVLGNISCIAPDLNVFVMYGLTEVSGRLCILNPARQREKVGSVGKPLDGMSVTIVSESGVALPAGELGEVHVKGPMVMAGYRDVKREEWCHPLYGFKTGDWGFLDEEGFLWLRGRRDGVFKSGGEKISVLLIQEKILELDCFEDVAVVPKEDPLLGVVPAVFFVSKDIGKSEEIRLVKKKLRETLPENHIPKRWTCVEEIKRTGSGKIIKGQFTVDFQDR